MSFKGPPNFGSYIHTFEPQLEGLVLVNPNLAYCDHQTYYQHIYPT